MSFDPLVRFATQKGIDVRTALAEAGVPTDLMDNRDERLSFTQSIAFFEQLVRRSRDRAFHVHVAEQRGRIGFDLYGHMQDTCTTLGESMRAMVRYYRLLIDVPMDVLADENVTRIRVTVPTDLVVPAIEFTYVRFVCRSRERSGTRWVPRDVTFQGPPPPYRDELQNLLRAPVRYDHWSCDLVLDNSLLELPFRPVDLRVRDFLSSYADEMLSRLPPVGSFIGMVRKIISDMLPENVPDLQHLAQRLHMSVRTLQRRLRESGTSHQQLVDQTRHDLALGYLLKPRATIAETAFVLGFSDLAGFYRAFKRWTGMTPSQYRDAELARREPAPGHP
jgi:AraC-like DNA-binding protein